MKNFFLPFIQINLLLFRVLKFEVDKIYKFKKVFKRILYAFTKVTYINMLRCALLCCTRGANVMQPDFG